MDGLKKYISLGTIAVCLLIILSGGCGGVRRELTIKTQPEGGLVALNDEEIGTAPVTVSFNWYGDYNVRISKPGYQTLSTHRKLKAPWYDSFPFDFVAAFLWPSKTVDKYEWIFELKPYQAAGREELIKSAEEMRKDALTELAAPAQVKVRQK